MSKKKNQEIPAWAISGHAKPVTRRDFLAHGMIPFAAAATLPAWSSILFGAEAHAENVVCASGGSGLIPFVSLNLAGGAAMQSNYVPMDAGGNPLKSYSMMGLGDGQVPIEREFGGVPFAGNLNDVLISNILKGIRNRAQKSTLDNTAFLSFCVHTRDDSRENKLDISGLVSQAGMVGSKFPNLGVSNTPTGVNQTAAIVGPPSPLVVGNFKSLANVLTFTGSLGTQLNSNQKGRLAKLITNLNSSQARTLASTTSAQGLQTLLECAGLKNESLLTQGASDIDPAGNAAVASLWGIAANANTNSESYVFSSLVYNALQGNSGTVSLQKGGYDYHNNTRTTGNTMDLQAGEVIGRTLETAAILGKPVVIYVTSDGSVSSVSSETDRQSAWTSDRGIAGVAYMLVYDPKGRRATSGFQVGNFTNGQAVDETFPTSADPERTAQAVFANYLALNGKLGMFNSIISSRGLDSATLSKVLKFA